MIKVWAINMEHLLWVNVTALNINVPEIQLSSAVFISILWLFNMSSIDKNTSDGHDRMWEMAQEMWILKLETHLGFKFRNIYVQMYISEATNMYTCYLFLISNFILYIQPLKMERIEGSETSANHNRTPGKYPKEYIQNVIYYWKT
jgi:hypothetical protein